MPVYLEQEPSLENSTGPQKMTESSVADLPKSILVSPEQQDQQPTHQTQPTEMAYRPPSTLVKE